MKAVKFTKALDGYAEGQVVKVDDLSADVLVKRGDAALVEDKPAEVPGGEVEVPGGDVTVPVEGDPVEVPAEEKPDAEKPATRPARTSTAK